MATQQQQVMLPECLAMVFSRASRINPSTGEKDLLGVWNELRAASFPHHENNICLYLLFMGGMGTVNFNLRFTLRNTVVFDFVKAAGSSPCPFTFTAQNEAVDLMLDLAGGVTFPQPGIYHASIYGNGTELITRPLKIAPGSSSSP